jgi:hypothetical protein
VQCVCVRDRYERTVAAPQREAATADASAPEMAQLSFRILNERVRDKRRSAYIGLFRAEP